MRWVLLCEDLQQENLLRPILTRKLGRPKRVERRGGFPFVLKQLPIELVYVRQRPTEAVALVVVVDADTKGFRARLEELRTLGKLKDWKSERQLGICIPSRNVETWVLWLSGESDIDEVTDYKRRVTNQSDGGLELTRNAVQAWDVQEPSRRALEKSRLPALTHARAEIDRLSQLAKV